MIKKSLIWNSLLAYRASLVAQMVKNLPAMRQTWVQSLGWEDPLEEEMAIPLQYSSEEPGRLQSMGLKRVRHDWATKPSGQPSG